MFEIKGLVTKLVMVILSAYRGLFAAFMHTMLM